MQSGLALRSLAVIIVMLTAATAWAQTTNENETPMVSDQTFTLPEKQSGGKDWPAGKTVGKVATNAGTVPAGSYLTYKVTTADVPFVFIYGTNELIVTDGSVLDYETKPIWTFNASVSDGELTQDFTVTVNLEDMNEAPVIEDVKNVYSVDENTATGIAFGSFTVFDPDAGDKLTYTLTGALTGAAGITGTLKNKTLADIFYVDEPANSSGKRTASIRVKSSALLAHWLLSVVRKVPASVVTAISLSIMVRLMPMAVSMVLVSAAKCTHRVATSRLTPEKSRLLVVTRQPVLAAVWKVSAARSSSRAL